MLETILAIATILGGISAAWFFTDKFRTDKFRRSRGSQSDSPRDPPRPGSPLRERVLTLSGEIEAFVLERRTAREETPVTATAQAASGTAHQETMRLFQERFWTLVVLLRDKIGREYAEGDHALNFSPHNPGDIEGIGRALRRLASRLP